MTCDIASARLPVITMGCFGLLMICRLEVAGDERLALAFDADLEEVDSCLGLFLGSTTKSVTDPPAVVEPCAGPVTKAGTPAEMAA
jgi:hypothetical protein